MHRSPALFVLCIMAVAAGALAFRLPRLDQRPMHGDEANQAKKAGLLAGIIPEEPGYRYNPEEHHGPSLYWLTLPSLWLSGAKDFAETTEFTYRLLPVVFGAGLILLVLLVSDGLGRGPATVASLLAAISPALVFYSRYYIQETLLVCFTFAAIGCAWRYVRSGSLGWAVASGVSFGLMHATKETWILAAAAMAAALVLAAAWGRWRDGRWPAIRTHLRPWPILAAVVAALLVAVALYSSFGTNWHGPIDSILAYATYWRRGSEAGIHTHPWYEYLRLLTFNRPARGFFWSEGLIAGLAAVGFLASLFLRQRSGGQDSLSLRERAGVREAGRGCSEVNAPHPNSLPKGEGEESQPSFLRFLAFYTITLTALYSAVPYKTPWCMLSFLHGMILLAGVGAWALLRWMPWVALKALVSLLLVAGALHLARECYLLNYRFYADRRNPYVYAHTSADVLNLAAQMERLAQVSPEGHDMMIHVVAGENEWPLPWYLRQFNQDLVGYWKNVADWRTETRRLPPPSIIILTQDVQPEVDARLPAAYNRQMLYGLRPEVFLSVYVREDLWQAFVASMAVPVAQPGDCR